MHCKNEFCNKNLYVQSDMDSLNSVGNLDVSQNGVFECLNKLVKYACLYKGVSVLLMS